MSEKATPDDFAQVDDDSECGFNSSQSEINLSRLEDYISIINGTKPDRVSDEQHDNSEPYLVVSTLTGEERKYTPDTDGPRATPRDTIMIMDGSKSGRVYSGENGIIGSTMAAIRPEHTNPQYLRYFLESNFERLNSATKGSAVPHTDKDLLSSLEYPVYPLPEQRKIASVLYTVDQAIQNTREIIDQRKRIRKGLRQDLFAGLDSQPTRETRVSAVDVKIPQHWDLKSVGEVSTQITDGAHLTPDRSEDGYLLLSARNVRDGYLDLYEVDYVPENEYQRLIKRCNPQPGDILISCSGTVGRVCKVPENLKFALVRSAALVKFDDSIIPSYGEKVLQSSEVQKQMIGYQTQSAQPNLFQGEIASLEIPIPPAKEQREIAEKLDEISSAIDVDQRYKFQLQRLKRGLMQDLLSGEVRTQKKDIELVDSVL